MYEEVLRSCRVSKLQTQHVLSVRVEHMNNIVFLLNLGVADCFWSGVARVTRCYVGPLSISSPFLMSLSSFLTNFEGNTGVQADYHIKPEELCNLNLLL